MRIALIHKGRAYKPEITAYKQAFEHAGFQFDILKEPNARRLLDYQVEYHFTGLDLMPKSTKRIKIHEYTSSSIPPFPKVKNHLKKWINTKPDLRIFQTEEVKNQFNFQDAVPHMLRGPGFGTQFLNLKSPNEKKFDFVYLGAMEPVRQINTFLQAINENFDSFTVLMIGEAPGKLKTKFDQSNIKFTGRVPYSKVPDLLNQATYGVNFMPDKYPFNIQPSIKLLEYCATGLKTITTDYQWVNEFERSKNARFFKLKSDFSNFKNANIEAFDFLNPDLSDLTWPKVIEQSGIVERIIHLCNGLPGTNSF